MDTATLKAAFKTSIPVLAGYLFLGFAYGVLMHNLGYGPFWTTAMSILVYGGSIQFVAVGLLASGFQPANAFIVSLVINARHLFYGFSMLGAYANTGWKKPLLIFWLTDETFSLVCSDAAPPGIDPDRHRFLVSALDYAYWVTGSLLGGVVGTLVSFNAAGIEFVMTALFAVIVVNQWLEAKTHAPALIGGAASLAALAAFGPRYFIIPAMALTVAALLACQGRLSDAVLHEDTETTSRADGGATT